MADLSSGQVRAIARLARLRIDDGDAREMARQLGRILDAFSVLAAVDLDAAAPADPVTEVTAGAQAAPATGGLRPDQPAPCLSREDALAQAPDAAAGHFRVPRVLA